jgi:F-type H+-transporting ATPase subunit delta
MRLRSEKVRLLTTALGPDANELSKRFIELVLKEGREKVLQFMANSYITFYREQKNIIRGKLTTAAAVSEATEQKMKQMVESRTQGTVEFNTEVDPSIIGGFILEYDTYRMDASVKTRLNNILSELK